MALHTVPFIINGEERFAKDTFEVTSPATGEVVHLCGVATVSEADAAVAAAAAATAAWRDVAPSARRDILLRAAALMDQKRPELGRYLVAEIGQPSGWAEFNLDVAVDMIKDAAGRVSTLAGAVPTPADPDTSAMLWREPFGVVLAIAPW